ncbi:MAG: hypothetical protein NZ561_05485, partial [Phycisphaerae bacterium]|nr:hypothetical protein [Phycisphaerae bacterium]MDW8263122.1 hypothetical protein [Phycisphaerales bacterium]
MGRHPGRHLLYLLIGTVVALACAARGQAPAESLVMEANRARTWSMGETSAVALDGGVTILSDRVRLYAQQAVVWVRAAPGSPGVQIVEIALIGQAKVEQATGIRSGSRIMVNLPVRGTIRVTAQQRLAVDASDSELYQQAERMRRGEPEEAPPPRQPAPTPPVPGVPPAPEPRAAAPARPETPPAPSEPRVERPEVAPQPEPTAPERTPAPREPLAPFQAPDRPAEPVASTQPSAPINFQAREIETRAGPDGKMIVLLSGGVTLLSRRDNGD